MMVRLVLLSAAGLGVILIQSFPWLLFAAAMASLGWELGVFYAQRGTRR